TAAHVSFRSHHHHRPQSRSLQIARDIVTKIQMGERSRMARKVRRSSVSSEGSRAAIAEPFNHDLIFVLRSFSRYRPAQTKLDTRIPDDAIMLVTWIFNQ